MAKRNGKVNFYLYHPHMNISLLAKGTLDWWPACYFIETRFRPTQGYKSIRMDAIDSPLFRIIYDKA